MRQNQTGLAMVIVIWVLSLMTIMAGSFALTMRREITVISSVKDNAVAIAAAETGITVAEQMLLLADKEKRWHADGRIYQLHYQDTEIRVRVLSEQGKVDINKAGEPLLTTIMTATSIDMAEQQALVSAILDWRDKDDLVHINGAEEQQYEEAGLSYQPANKAFNQLDELQMVLGMNATVFNELQPLITVHSGLPNVNLKVASKEVIQIVTGIGLENEQDFLQQDMETDSDKVQNLENNEVYSVISQVRLFGELTAGIKVMLKKTANGNQSKAFKVLNWQPIYQELSLFNDESNHYLVTE